MRSSSVEEVGGHGPGDPWEVFTALAILVVEGRTPGGEKGYHAGPHCPLPHQMQHKHSCDLNDNMCMQAAALVRQLRVMWGVGVGVSLEVLVAPECQHGAALTTTLDTPIAPSQNLRLIEQWNFTIYDRRLPEAAATGWSLVAAVRSFLHFSQLSAWLSVSRGRRPPNVLYRLTVTSPVFCSKFTEEAEEHVFPLAYMGQDTSIKVAVRSLPRSEKVPVVVCQEAHEDDYEEMQSDESLPSCSQSKSEMARTEEDLRRSVMKARLAENTRVTRSESPDTQLGESLLDPPNSLTRFPRRYQSPSRSGSPSLETPEHLICRHRHPVPPNSRPPDGFHPDIMPFIPSAARHPFSWTQARYPMPPLNIHPTSHPVPHHPGSHPGSLGPLCPSGGGLPHQHQHQQPSSHQTHQTPYKIDYSGPYHPFQRPHLVYGRPQVYVPQQPSSSGQAQLQKPQPSSLRHPLHPISLEQFQKQQQQQQQQQQPGGLSPNGRKYQNYPEYKFADQMEEGSRETTTTTDYAGPFKRYKSQNQPGDEYTEAGYSGKPQAKGDYQDLSIFQSTFSFGRPGASTHRWEMERKEGTSDWEFRKNSHNGGKTLQCHQQPMEAESSQEEPDGMSGRKSSSRLKRASPTSEERSSVYDALPKVIDDQLRPCCSHTGKHLCSSMEDLSEVCDKELEHSYQLQAKDLKKEMKHKGVDVSPSHLLRSKFNFDLTPKETMEILSVLRQPNDLRIDNSRSQYRLHSPKGNLEVKNLHLTSDLGFEKSLWVEKDLERKLLKGKGKKLEDCLWKRGERSEVLAIESMEDEVTSTTATATTTTATSSLMDLKASQPGSSFPSSSSFRRPSSECCKSPRCHTESGDKSDAQVLPTSSAEKGFPEAISLCSDEKPCDIPSYKPLVDSREPFWTRVSCDNSVCDKENEMKKDRIMYRLEEGYRESDRQQCIEAKKVTHKTNFYTACSEPTKAVRCQPQKQVSQVLSKSPFSAVLSCIQKEYNQQEKNGELLSHAVKAKPNPDAKESVKRVLNFQEESKEKFVYRKHENDEEEEPNAVLKSQPDKIDGDNAAVRLRGTRDGFVRSASLLKHLMTRGYHTSQPQETSQDDKTPLLLDGDGRSDAELSITQLEDSHKSSNRTESKNEGDMQIDDLNSEDDEVESYCNERGVAIPSASEKAQFRRSLDSATNMVFHSKTGLPLTSSPAPLRKGKRFDYDSSLTCVAAIKRSTSFHCSALYTCDAEEEEAYHLEMDATFAAHKAARRSLQLSMSAPATVTCSNLLGNFEECVLNGRLEPVSTVQGFTAEIAASGSFCPKRTTKPVTVFFYTLCDNDQISSPYMGHINLGKKGYHVPSKGTVQVTLFNPHGTVVKMFVVMYDLSDMPPNSRTFVRQRTLNMPVGASDTDENAHQWLRYLIHLRFVSSKSGKIYLHTDVRMLILRKSDADAATLHKTSVPYELRSFTHGPTNPKFSPRK